MADTPKFRSYQQTISDILDAFSAKSGIGNLKVGSVLLSIIEAAAQSDVRGSQDIMNVLAQSTLDRAENQNLDRIGLDENIPRLAESPATGTVTISDNSFTKISSRVYQGTGNLVAGVTAVSIDSVDALLFPASGAIHIGRGTPNYEGPIAYTSKTVIGSRTTLNLATPTTKYHDMGESVILSQGGDRFIVGGTVVRTSVSVTAPAVEFKTLYPYTIFDGETTLSNVSVVAVKPGVDGNIARGAIVDFADPPFNGATVTNELPFTNGLQAESDDDYRNRIRNIRASRTKGTKLAVTTSVIGAMSKEEGRRILSASSVRTSSGTTLYIDDGTGYESVHEGIGKETLVESVKGGEQYVEAAYRPIAQAFVISRNETPFKLEKGAQLAVKVGGVLSVHAFNEDAFASIESASAHEVVASINGNPDLLFRARTYKGGKYVIIFAKQNENDDIQVVKAGGNDANDAFLFESNRNFTTLLYKNDRLLNKDGQLASITSRDFDHWGAITGPVQTIEISVDKTPPLLIEIKDQHFIDAKTGYTSLGNNSLSAWAAVFNMLIPGVTTTVENDRLVLTSNRGRSSSASLEINPIWSSLASIMFGDSLSAVGADKDYTLDRATSQIMLNKILKAGDTLTLGTDWPRAFIETPSISTISLTSSSRMWVDFDGDAVRVPINVSSSYVFKSKYATPHGHIIEATVGGTGGTFEKASLGDDIIFYDDAFPSKIKNHYVIGSNTVNSANYDNNSMSLGRYAGTFTRLADGRVLAVGGLTGVSPSWIGDSRTATEQCELFDPTTGVWTIVTPMSTPRYGHAAILLSSGNVAVFGGQDANGNFLSSIEIYNPGTNTWSLAPVSLPAGVRFLQVTPVGSQVLATGGEGLAGDVNTATLYDSTISTIVSSSTMAAARSRHRAVTLGSDVYVFGGGTNVTEKFSAGVWTTLAPMPVPLRNHAAVRISNDEFLVVGGQDDSDFVSYGTKSLSPSQRYRIYNTTADAWTKEYPLLGNVKHSPNDLPKPFNEPVRVMTFTLPNSPVWAPGGPATITATTSGVLVVDGVTLSVGDRVAVAVTPLGPKSYGIYTVTDDGSGVNPWSMERAQDMRHADQIVRNIHVVAIEGTINAGTVLSFYADSSYIIDIKDIYYTISADLDSFLLGFQYSDIIKMAPLTGSPPMNHVVIPVGRGYLEDTKEYRFHEIFAFTYTLSSNHRTYAMEWMGANPLRGYKEIHGVTPINRLGTTLREVWYFGGLEKRYNMPVAAVRASIIHSNAEPALADWWTRDTISSDHGSFSTVTALSKSGVSVTRSKNYPQQITVPAASYTASTLASTLNSLIEGGNAKTYKTTKVRISTNSFNNTGDISILAQESGASTFGLPSESRENFATHFGSVTSASSVGTPTFWPSWLFHAKSPTLADYVKTATIYTNSRMLGGETIVINRRPYAVKPDDKLEPLYGLNAGFKTGVALIESQHEAPSIGHYSQVGLRKAVNTALAPNEVISLHHHYALNEKSTLAVVIDGDAESKRYVANLYRKIKPVTNVYGSTNSFTDADNGNASLAQAFGLSYDFSDLAVFMRARGKSHVGSSTKEALWRWYQPGLGGEKVSLSYHYPDAEDKSVEVFVVDGQRARYTENAHNSDINVVVSLGSGSKRTGSTIYSKTGKIGMAVGQTLFGVSNIYLFFGYPCISASRDASHVTTATLQVQDASLPTGPASGGLSVGDQIWWESSHGSWASGVVTIGAVGPMVGDTFTITFIAPELTIGTPMTGPHSNPAVISFNTQGDTVLDPAISVNDYGWTPGKNGSTSIKRLRTFRVLANGPKYVKARVIDRGIVAGVDDGYVLSLFGRHVFLTPILSDGNVNFFANKGETINQIVDAVNALAGDTDSTCPVTAKSLGSGTGVQILASWDEANNANAKWKLKDGLNYVAKVTNTLPLPNTSVNYDLKFKRPIDAELVGGGSDWASEDVWLVPVHAHTLSKWLSSLAITGLSTTASVHVANAGSGVQISTLTPGSSGSVQVQSSNADSALIPIVGNPTLVKNASVEKYSDVFNDSITFNIPRSMADGIVPGGWIDIENTSPIQKRSPDPTLSFRKIPVGIPLKNISEDGVILFDYFFSPSPDLYTELGYMDVCLLKFETFGDFVEVRLVRHINSTKDERLITNPPDGYPEKAQIVIIDTPIGNILGTNVPDANIGSFRIEEGVGEYINSTVNSEIELFWIRKKPGMIDGTYDCSIRVLTSHSLVPGDFISIETDALQPGNKGLWRIASVGIDYNSHYMLQLDTSDRKAVPFNGSRVMSETDSQLINFYESAPITITKKVQCVYPNPKDSSLMTVNVIGGEGYEMFGESLGSIVKVRDKLNFGNKIHSGVDSYVRHTGLIEEASKILYGVSGDQHVYPGVVADGASVDISGSIVKRVKIGVAIRTRIGVPTDEVADRVRSAVATVINRSGVGESVAFSDIIAEASNVGGVVSVSIVSPTYNSIDDRIEVQPFEKLLVLDVISDVSVSFVGF